MEVTSIIYLCLENRIQVPLLMADIEFSKFFFRDALNNIIFGYPVLIYIYLYFAEGIGRSRVGSNESMSIWLTTPMNMKKKKPKF